MNTLIEVHNTSVTRGKVRILKNINFTLCRGENTVIYGANGSGKSTLLRLIRGDINPDLHGGEVIWHTEKGPETFPAIGQGMSALVSSFQAENYVRKSWQITGKTIIFTGFSDTFLPYSEPSEREVEAVHSLARCFAIEELLERELPQFSQGQLRLILLARAIIRKPEILLLDEFADGLDSTANRRINQILELLTEYCTILMVTHRQENLPTFIMRSIKMHAGNICEDKPIKSSVPLIDRRHRIGVYEEKIKIAGQTLKQITPENPENRPLLINIVNADVFIDGFHILHKINWKLRKGENWAILGPNGAGKSTFLRLIYGLENVALGGYIERLLPGQGEGVIREMKKIHRGIGIVSDKIQATYRYNISCEDLVLSGFEGSVGLFTEPDAVQVKEAKYWMKHFGVWHLAKHKIRTTSTGELRRLMLARAIIGKPDLILLDEPCAGLDPDARSEFLYLTNDLARSGVHFVIVSHHEADIFPAISHIAWLNQGKIDRQYTRLSE